MKWKKDCLYEETAIENILWDAEAKRSIVFCLDIENKLIIRSMFEEDINPVLIQHNQSSSTKRQLKRAMGKDLVVPGSELAYFVVEKLTTDISETDYDAEHQLVSYESKIIGFAARKNADFHLCLNVIEKQSNKALLKMFTQIRDVLGFNDGLLYMVCH